MQQYVAGLLFNADATQVAMVFKHKPAWQRWHFNAIGGKVELGETPRAAIVREFNEEAGLYLPWEEFAVLAGSDFEVYFYRCFSDEIQNISTREAEEIVVFPVDGLPGNIIDNLKDIVPLALRREPSVRLVHEPVSS